jgi:glycosyltransferase involved in cell wall biosynthesis
MTMRVLQVLHQGGGAGSVTSTLHLSLGLARAGVDVRFACPPDSEVEHLARAGGLEVLPLALAPRARRRNAGALATLLERHPCDLVNSQSARDRQALTLLAWMGRLEPPLVLTRRQMPRTLFVETWLAARAAARVVAVSEAVAAALARKGTPRRKLAVIPNGLVLDRVDPVPDAASVAVWRERIGWRADQRTVGILARPKDQEVVLRALARVRTPVRLVLAGVGSDHPLAYIARSVAPPHAAVALPFTMALGKPVIASAAAGNLDLVTSGADGLLAPPLDPTGWAAAIDRVLTEPELAARLGARARVTARERFSLVRTVERTLELYRKVLADRLAPPAHPG